MSRVTEVRNLGNQYGNLGSALLRRDGRYFVVSGTDRWGTSEWIVVPATRHGRIASWRDLATRATKAAAIGELARWDGKCHCGTEMGNHSHCPVCSCPLFAIPCGERHER